MLLSQLRFRWLVLPCMILASGFLAACEEGPDEDLDGLDDRWEAQNTREGVSPGRPDLLVMTVLRPGMTTGDIAATLEGIRRCFADIGVTVSFLAGNPLPAEHATTPYTRLRDTGLRSQWRGKVHGLLLEKNPGAGQTNGPDWSGSGNDWRVACHELGHQLGLKHEPLGSTFSPFYASMMNYDYSYSFEGSPQNVRFGRGRLKGLSLDERDLNETLPFSESELSFLKFSPYDFSMRAVSSTQTQIDFNRNGIFGETGVRADINDGYSVSVKERQYFTQASGGFALTQWGEGLAMVAPVPVRSVNWKTYAGANHNRENPSGLRYQIFLGGRMGAARSLEASGVSGEPTAVQAFGKFVVAYPTLSGFTVRTLRSNGWDALQSERLVTSNTARRLSLSLIRTEEPERLQLLLWDEGSQQVSTRGVEVARDGGIVLGAEQPLFAASGSYFRSAFAVGAVYDTARRTLWVAHTTSSQSEIGKLWLTPFELTSQGWQSGPTEPVGGPRAWEPYTVLKPSLALLDPIPGAAAPELFLYSLRVTSAEVPHQLLDLRKRTLNASSQAVWRHRIMINEWSSSRSAPVAVAFQDDIAFAWRMNEGFKDLENRVEVGLVASGVSDSGLTDFDDATWILTRGLQDSLRAVR
jgi:hypothetical protein